MQNTGLQCAVTFFKKTIARVDPIVISRTTTRS